MRISFDGMFLYVFKRFRDYSFIPKRVVFQDRTLRVLLKK